MSSTNATARSPNRPIWRGRTRSTWRAARRLTRQERPGARMYHCHIREHEQLGMMGIIDVKA
nr:MULTISPECIES: multicopper oxidase domain-containing protein [unclassified Mesorhizobium]